MLRNTKQAKIATNEKVDLAVAVVDNIDLGAIFGMFFSEVTHRFLEEIGKYFMFPIAAAATLIRAVLALRRMLLDTKTVDENGVIKQRMKTGNIVRFAVEATAALAITVAVVGALAFAAVMGAFAPMIFTAVLGAKALFHAAAALFYFGRSWGLEKDDPKKQVFLAKAKGNAVGALALTFATAAVYLVMLAGHTVFAAFGVTAGVIATVFGGYNLYKKMKAERAHVVGEEKPSFISSTFATLRKLVLGIEAEKSKKVVVVAAAVARRSSPELPKDVAPVVVLPVVPVSSAVVDTHYLRHGSFLGSTLRRTVSAPAMKIAKVVAAGRLQM